MATMTAYATTNFEFTNSRQIRFFDVWCVELEDSRWDITIRGWERVDASSVIRLIQYQLQRCVTLGRAGRVKLLCMGPEQAAALFSRGLITPRHLNNVTEYSRYVYIPNFKYMGFNLTIRVVQYPIREVSIADEAGNRLT